LTSADAVARRNDTIDSFRGIAILAVMTFHYLEGGIRWGTSVARYGQYGVELFFIISGLVITMTALRASSPMEFAARRFARIYPTFAICATFTFLLTKVHDPIGIGMGFADYLASLTLAADRIGFRYIDGAYWSLFVELLFYGAVAVSLAILGRRFWIGVLVLLVGGAFLRLASKAIGVLLIADYSSFFLLGMAVWYATREGDRRAALALLAGAVVTYAMGQQAHLQWPALLPGAALIALLFLGRNWTIGPLAWIGRISYPLYLLHQVLGLILIADLLALGLPRAVAFGGACLAMIGLAWLAHIFIEEPSQRLVMRWWRLRRPHADDRAIAAG